MSLRFDAGKVGIIGVGLIGGSILRALSDRGYHVWGYDIDPKVPRLMAQEGYEHADSVEDLLSGSRLVVIATPPEATVDLVASLPAQAPHAVFTTTASVMGPAARAVAALPADQACRVVLGHPMAGSEFSGFDRSRHDLFWSRSHTSDDPLGATWALAPANGEGASLLSAVLVSGLVDAVRASTLFVDPSGHDGAVAYSSHLVQLVATALAQAAPPHLRARAMLLSGGGLWDTTRVASSDPELSAQIVRSNRAALRDALNDMLVLLERMDGCLEDVDADPYEQLPLLLTEGQRARTMLYNRRWRERRWQDYELEPVALPELIRLGQDGHLLRHLTLQDGRLTGEVAYAS